MSNSYFNFNKSLSSTRWTSLYFESVLLVRREYSKTAVPSSKVRGALSERLSFPRREELKTVRARSLSPGAILRQTWNLCSAIVAYSDHSFFPVCGFLHFQTSFRLHFHCACRWKLAWKCKEPHTGTKEWSEYAIIAEHKLCVCTKGQHLLSRSKVSDIQRSYAPPPIHKLRTKAHVFLYGVPGWCMLWILWEEWTCGIWRWR